MAKIRLSRKAIADLDGIWDYTVETWSEDQAVVYYRQIHTSILGLNRLPAFLEKKYEIIKPGLMGHKVGHHIIFYRKHRDGSIWVVRILHERMDYQRHLKATYGP
ncbi:toxin ParE1/3/4 [Bacteroidales bacterium WCE2004]|nr:toxin ParE1/3/4 [Bacteroidales bacterium WCE2004]